MSKYIDLTCAVCKKIFPRLLKQFKYEKKKSGDNYSPLCSKECKKLFKSTKQLVNCENCFKTFEKTLNQIKKSEHNFCSRSCSVSFNNKNIKRSNFPDKQSSCIICQEPCLIKANASHKTALCEKCKSRTKAIKINGEPVKPKRFTYTCQKCNNVVVVDKPTANKYCYSCLKEVQKLNGLKSVQAQSEKRRSKNEIYFSELCKKEFGNISTNDPIFVSKYGNWDADVIIHDYKIAVLWNGIWHYQKVRAKHSVTQVQARDKIKIDVIKNNGYIPYIIKDLGKFNPKFVETEFLKLKQFIEIT